MNYVDKLNLIMPRLNDVRLPASSREIVSLHPYLGKPRSRPLVEIPSLERFTQNLEYELEGASLNNPVRGGTILLKTRDGSLSEEYRING